MRSGTIHRLHVSEFGKICAKYPDKAQEVVTGSIPAVPMNGVLVIESTAEGRDGDFFKMVQIAEANEASRKLLGFVTRDVVGRSLAEAARSRVLQDSVLQALSESEPVAAEFEVPGATRRVLALRDGKSTLLP